MAIGSGVLALLTLALVLVATSAGMVLMGKVLSGSYGSGRCGLTRSGEAASHAPTLFRAGSSTPVGARYPSSRWGCSGRPS